LFAVVRACVRVCVLAWVRAGVCACVRACVRTHYFEMSFSNQFNIYRKKKDIRYIYTWIIISFNFLEKEGRK